MTINLRTSNFRTTSAAGAEASRHAIQWLDRLGDQPFFLFLHFMDPHNPYIPPEPFASQHASNPYAGEIAYVDQCVGRVLDHLKKLGLEDSTMVVIAGDHGESLGEHSEEEHGFFIYQSTVRVPLIVKSRGRVKARRVKHEVGLVDVMPTILGAAGLEIPPEVVGIDLAAYGTDPREDPAARDIYCETLWPTQYGCNPLMGLVSGGWKYIHTARPELYDLRSDPAESKNLTAQDAKRAQRMKTRLREIVDQQTRPPDAMASIQPDAENVRRLQGLGYIGGTFSPADLSFDAVKSDAKDFASFHQLRRTVGRLMLRKKYDMAEKLLTSMADDHPDVVYVHWARGDLAMQQHEPEQARARFNEGLKIEPHPVWTQRILKDIGKALHQVGRFDDALAYWQEAVLLKPLDMDARKQIAQLYFERGKLEQAAEHWLEILVLYPEDYATHGNLGTVYFQQGDMERARKHWEEVLRLHPGDLGAHSNLGIAAFEQGRIGEAIEHWEAALKIKPDHPQLRGYLQKAYAKRRGQE